MDEILLAKSEKESRIGASKALSEGSEGTNE